MKRSLLLLASLLLIVTATGCGSPSSGADASVSPDLFGMGMPVGSPCTKAFDCAPSTSGCKLCTYYTPCGVDSDGGLVGMTTQCNQTCTVSLNDCPSGLTCMPLSSPGYGNYQSGSGCGDGFCYPITC